MRLWLIKRALSLLPLVLFLLVVKVGTAYTYGAAAITGALKVFGFGHHMMLGIAVVVISGLVINDLLDLLLKPKSKRIAELADESI